MSETESKIEELSSLIASLKSELAQIQAKVEANQINIDTISNRLSRIENNGLGSSVRQISTSLNLQNQKILKLEKRQRGI